MDDSTIIRIVATAALVVVVLVVRRIAVQRACRRADTETLYRTRKLGTYLAAMAIVVGAAFVWADRLGSVATGLAVVSAGLAVALADVFVNLAGWVYIIVRRPFSVGDRVEIGDRQGDVIDVRVLRFTLLEIGGWVDADQHTGRVVHVPNGQLFRQPLANYTETFEFVWHEMPVLVTFESDWERAEEIVAGALAGCAMSSVEMGATDRLEAAGRAYLVERLDHRPATYVSVRDSGVLVTGRVLIDAHERRRIDDLVWREVLAAFATDDTVDFAYPTTRFYQPAP